MTRSPHAAAALMAALAVALPAALALGTDDGRTPHPGPLHERAERAVAEADSLRFAGRADEALARLEAFGRTARAAADVVHEAQALTHRGRLLMVVERAREAEAQLERAIGLAERAGDPEILCEALIQRCFAVDAQGRPPRAIPLMEALRATAERLGQPRYVAQADMLLARRMLQAGDLAGGRDLLERSLAHFEREGPPTSVINAHHLLGLAHARMGRFADARRHWRTTGALAESAGNVMMAAGAITNLGGLEYELGDPGVAADHLLRAVALYRSDGRTRSALPPGLNAATVLAGLGRHDVAESLLTHQLAIAREHGYADLVASHLRALGDLASRRERPREAARWFRDALAALPAGDHVEERSVALRGLAVALEAQDSVAAALALLEREAMPLRAGASAIARARLDERRGECLLALGRGAEALPILAAVDRDAAAHGLVRERLAVAPALAEAQRRAGRLDDAIATLERATALWESERSTPRDAEWREVRGAAGVRIFTDLAALALERAAARGDADSVRIAYDLLQRLKSRTLLERLAGPGGAADTAAFATLAPLVSGVLADGELLLDAFLGPRHGFLFAIGRDRAELVRWPGADSLGPALRGYHALLATRPGAEDRARGRRVADEAARALGHRLFGPVADRLLAARHVIVVPDGDLNRVPIAPLALAGGSGPEPLVAGERTFALFPSATLLARARSRAVAPPAGASARLFAAAGSHTSDGARLVGAAREVRRIERAYANVHTHEGPGTAAAELDGFDVLHFAAHARVDDQRPWRSGIVFTGSGEDGSRDGSGADPGAGEPDALTADRIATLALPAALVVLSGCETAGGRVLAGEGVLGLTAAFLGAGARGVVATLWPVDDRATAELMGRFYGHLAAGRAPAAALRAAQLELRARPETAHPFYWAGFVLIGEGDAPIALRRRPPVGEVVLAGAALALAGAGIALVRARRRRAA